MESQDLHDGEVQDTSRVQATEEAPAPETNKQTGEQPVAVEAVPGEDVMEAREPESENPGQAELASAPEGESPVENKEEAAAAEPVEAEQAADVAAPEQIVDVETDAPGDTVEETAAKMLEGEAVEGESVSGEAPGDASEPETIEHAAAADNQEPAAWRGAPEGSANADVGAAEGAGESRAGAETSAENESEASLSPDFADDEAGEELSAENAVEAAGTGEPGDVPEPDEPNGVGAPEAAAGEEIYFENAADSNSVEDLADETAESEQGDDDDEPQTSLVLVPESVARELDQADERDVLKAVVEAAIYITDDPLTPEQIAQALQQPIEVVRELLTELVEFYAPPSRGLTIRELAGGYKLGTKPEYHEPIRQFVKKLQPPLKLSLPALETLAVIAYKQPITAPEIMEIRGVQGAGVLKTLLDRKLIATAGRKDVIGKPIMYKTTKEFLIQFGLSSLKELPTLKEFEELGRLALTDEEEGTPLVETAPAAESATATAGEEGAVPVESHEAAAAEGAAEERAEEVMRNGLDAQESVKAENNG